MSDIVFQTLIFGRFMEQPRKLPNSIANADKSKYYICLKERPKRVSHMPRRDASDSTDSDSESDEGSHSKEEAPEPKAKSRRRPFFARRALTEIPAKFRARKDEEDEEDNNGNQHHRPDSKSPRRHLSTYRRLSSRHVQPSHDAPDQQPYALNDLSSCSNSHQNHSQNSSLRRRRSRHPSKTADQQSHDSSSSSSSSPPTTPTDTHPPLHFPRGLSRTCKSAAKAVSKYPSTAIELVANGSASCYDYVANSPVTPLTPLKPLKPLGQKIKRKATSLAQTPQQILRHRPRNDDHGKQVTFELPGAADEQQDALSTSSSSSSISAAHKALEATKEKARRMRAFSFT